MSRRTKHGEGVTNEVAKRDMKKFIERLDIYKSTRERFNDGKKTSEVNVLTGQLQEGEVEQH